jgi:hypothetical protein
VFRLETWYDLGFYSLLVSWLDFHFIEDLINQVFVEDLIPDLIGDLIEDLIPDLMIEFIPDLMSDLLCDWIHGSVLA